MMYSDLTTLAGKAVLVTEGTTEIGRATAALLVENKATVMIFGRQLPELDDALNQISMKFPDGTIYGILADAAEDADIKSVFEEVDRILGPIDILVNNAGLPYNTIIEEDYDEWQYLLNTNLFVYMAYAHEAVKRMAAKGSGHIVNIGAMTEKERSSAVLVATKSGIEGFSLALGKEINTKGIKVTFIESDAVGSDIEELPIIEQMENVEKIAVLKAEDIAASIYYALMQPKRCDVVEIKLRASFQLI
ncbi:SDR family oxidoreductase [Olivibacter domesticus]|uniref:NADP-dependent 3-hydroxy acid dehydrogenase YdfG n=1 Tax=Olivibacter domesticus TaxID=407022 RepID=A0A1H7KGE4_OLID1|nr:SDR family NAD(P)-dependent oxidoreductase [Olivibacter domesticus]SEK85566.1 NADP-dependent 3-hydroxy acid dehydrogenase YdfG [Olivibacter domesticus]